MTLRNKKAKGYGGAGSTDKGLTVRGVAENTTAGTKVGVLVGPFNVRGEQCSLRYMIETQRSGVAVQPTNAQEAMLTEITITNSSSSSGIAPAIFIDGGSAGQGGALAANLSWRWRSVRMR